MGKEVKALADAFISTWKKEGTWGNYVQVETGNVAVFNTTGGAMAVAGLALAARYYNEPVYLEVARAAAKAYYNDFALVGFTSGGCGDILQNADSETAIALTTSLITLYEATGEAAYLKQAKDLANLCATWTVSYCYQLPKETPLAKLGANLTGAVWASTQTSMEHQVSVPSRVMPCLRFIGQPVIHYMPVCCGMSFMPMQKESSRMERSPND